MDQLESRTLVWCGLAGHKVVYGVCLIHIPECENTINLIQISFTGTFGPMECYTHLNTVFLSELQKLRRFVLEKPKHVISTIYSIYSGIRSNKQTHGTVALNILV